MEGAAHQDVEKETNRRVRGSVGGSSARTHAGAELDFVNSCCLQESAGSSTNREHQNDVNVSSPGVNQGFHAPERQAQIRDANGMVNTSAHASGRPMAEGSQRNLPWNISCDSEEDDDELFCRLVILKSLMTMGDEARSLAKLETGRVLHNAEFNATIPPICTASRLTLAATAGSSVAQTEDVDFCRFIVLPALKRLDDYSRSHAKAQIPLILHHVKYGVPVIFDQFKRGT